MTPDEIDRFLGLGPLRPQPLRHYRTAEEQAAFDRAVDADARMLRAQIEAARAEAVAETDALIERVSRTKDQDGN